MDEEEKFIFEIPDEEEEDLTDLYKEVASNLYPSDKVLELNSRIGTFAGKYLAFLLKDFTCLVDSLVDLNKARRRFPGLKSNFRKFEIRDVGKIASNHDTVIAIDLFKARGVDIQIMRLLPSGTKLIFTLPLDVNSSDIFKRYRELLSITKALEVSSRKLLIGWVK